MAHTPGPWRAEQQSQHGATVYIYAAAEAWCPIAEHVNGFDNARLIAAAPDLLAALKNMQAAYSRTAYSPNAGQRYAHELADTAIAKAEGRS